MQDITRNHPKAAASVLLQGKTRSQSSSKKTTPSSRESSKAEYAANNGNAEEAEQRYAVAIEPPQHRPHFQPNPGYVFRNAPQHLPAEEQQQQRQYRIIPEEHFLKLIEQELQARAFHEAQLRQNAVPPTAASHKPSPRPQSAEISENSADGLSNYRQVTHETDAAAAPEYVQYVPRHRGGPKYLPLPNHPNRPQQNEIVEPQHQVPLPPHIPPQLAYYQPQISYKTLAGHPLAKSTLEKEIEKLLAANKPSAAAVQIVDNSNEPSAVVNHHQHAPPQRRLVQPKGYISSSTPNSLLDANNQPFIPSLFRFSNFQQPTPIYPTQITPDVVEAKKLGPVVYPTQAPAAVSPQPPAQPSQYYYQEAAPTPSSKPKVLYRPKQYGNKIPSRQQDLRKDAKYSQQLVYQFEDRPDAAAAQQAHFYPSPPDPNQIEPTAKPTQPTQRPSSPALELTQYPLPAASPSQSSIFVSQGTGIATPSRQRTTHKPKSVQDVRQLRLPQPGSGGKPLTQAEFQALVDAGYPGKYQY